jgi:20S proteasome alpha/beta subunit
VVIDDNKALALAGEAGEREHFGDYIQKNIHLLRYKHDQKLTVKQTANYMRYSIFQT